MIVLTTGMNAITAPRQDYPDPLPAALVCRLVNSTTKVEHWCALEDDGTLIDWVHFPLEVVAINADPVQSQVALGITPKSPSDFDLYIYGGTAYVQNPNLLTLITHQRARYGL